MFRLQFLAFDHQLDDDGRTAHRQRPRQSQRRLPAQTPDTGRDEGEQQGCTGCRQHGEEHLQQAQSKHMATHGAQLGEVELQPDDEHQENHAKLAQVANAFGVLRQRQRVGADHDADDQVTKHWGQLERTASDYTEYRREQVNQGQFQCRHVYILAREVPVYKMHR